MLQNLLHGFTSLGNGPAIGYLFAGALIGMFVGVVPGLGGAVVLSVILIFVYHINLLGTLCLFLGTHAGSYYSASVTSILLNTPAHPEAFPVTLDGFPMAQRGEPGRALGLSAASTFVGGLVGCGVLIGFIQILNELPGVFHPPELIALVTLAMLLVGTLGADSVGKAIIAAGAGLMVASIGPSVITGTFRYTFGAVGLYGGISLVALALGAFAIPQMAMIFGTGSSVARQDMTGREIGPSQPVDLSQGFGKQIVAGVFETFRHWAVLLQGGITGALAGLVPGIGGFAANFLSYGIAQQTSRKRSLFGTGIPEGIIAPEGASLAKEAGSMIPIIGLGIPGSVGGALFLAALTIKNIKPGYGFETTYPVVPYEIVWIIALSGLIGTLAGVLIGPFLAKVTRVPGPLIVPFIFALSALGPFLADTSFFAVMEVLAFGILGFGFRRLRYPLGSFILGLVLGPTFETNIYLTRNIYPGISFVTQRPMADVIFAIAFGVLILKVVEIRKEKKRMRAMLLEESSGASNATERAEAIRAQRLRQQPYPLLAMLMTIVLLVISIFFVVFGISNYDFTTGIMPVIGGLLVAVPSLCFLPRDVYRYVFYRRNKQEEAQLSKVKSPTALTHTADPGMQTPIASGSLTGHGSDLGLLETVILSSTTKESFNVSYKAWGRHGQFTRELTAFAWLFGLVGACWLFGFIWGIPTFMAIYGIVCTGQFLKTLLQRLLFAALSAAIMWAVVFEMFGLTHLSYTPALHL